MDRTTRDRTSGTFKWEMFTTRGIDRPLHKYLSFACHYMINRLERSKPFTANQLMPHYRNSDWVRVKGISAKLDIVVQPLSGFKVRAIMFQSSHTMNEINDNAEDEVPDNHAFDSSAECRYGGYDLNGRLLTQFVHRDDVPEFECGLHSFYADMFGFQKKTYDTIEYDKHIQSMRIRAPWVTTILDTRRTYINKTKKPKAFTFHRFLRMNTVWQYPPSVNHLDFIPRQETMPDKKVYFMLIVTPIHGPVSDNGMTWPDLEMGDGFQGGDPKDNRAVLYHRERSVSQFSERLKTPAVKMEDDDNLEYADLPPVPDPPRAVTSEAGPSRITRSMRRARISEAPDPEDPDADPIDDLADMMTEPVDDPALRLSAANDTVRDFVHALKLNREFLKIEREENPKPPKPPKPAKTPKPSRRPPKPPPLPTDDFGWAIDRSIMIRPTFKFWYRDMFERKRFGRSVGFPCR